MAENRKRRKVEIYQLPTDQQPQQQQKMEEVVMKVDNSDTDRYLEKHAMLMRASKSKAKDM